VSELIPQPHGGALLRRGQPGNKGGYGQITHGLHSKRYTSNERMQALIEKHATNPNPLDLIDDLARARALFEDWLDRAEKYSEALLAWHESYRERGEQAATESRLLAVEKVLEEYEILLKEREDITERQDNDLRSARALVAALRDTRDEKKPRRTMDIADGHKILLTVGKLVDTINRKDAKHFISHGTFVEIMRRLGFATRSVLNRWDGLTFNADRASDQVQEAWGQVPVV
jgi:hypothetical protein